MRLDSESRGFNEDYWCPTARSDDPAATAMASPVIDGALWVALLKLSNGDPIAGAEQDWLLAQKLIEIKNGATSLTVRGRSALEV